jgi:hypothetical protein
VCRRKTVQAVVISGTVIFKSPPPLFFKETNETRGKIVGAIYKGVFYLLPV